ncbi:MAG: HYR domain-containing protein [Lewinellaceae bacterium]|nr:HYR domain-containing protein [Lewinellaceae bacterium]
MKHTSTFRFIALLLICRLTAGAVFAQSTFQRTYGEPVFTNDEATSITTITGGYMITGDVVKDGPNSREAFLMKINPVGDILWQKTYGMAGGEEYFFHVVEANDGGFLAVGQSTSFGTGDIIVVKTDADGNPLWQKHIGHTDSNFSEIGYYIIPVSGGYIISGIGVTKTGFVKHNRGVMFRIDNNGDLIWSRLYSSGNSNTRNLIARHISGDTLFAAGQRDSSGVFALMSASTGNLISAWTIDGSGFPDEVLWSMAPASNGDFLLAGYVSDTTIVKQWVCRVSRSGELKWSKTYSNIGRGYISALSDDHFVLSTTPATYQNDQLDPILVKIDGNGEVVWSHKYGKAGVDVFNSAIEAPDGGIIAAGLTRTTNASPFLPEILVVKTDKNGLVANCCRQPAYPIPAPYQVAINPSGFIQTDFFDPMDFTLQSGPHDLTAKDYCSPGPPEQVFHEIFLCSGDSVLIDGTYYSSPGTVAITIPGSPCDTIVTYTIQYADPDAVTALSLQCPSDQVVQVPSGTASAVASYDPPSAQSDCQCPGIDLLQTQGLPTGSAFATGTHAICFQGQDRCGNVSGCCFQISIVEEEDACDVKNNGCITFELLRITRDAQWNRSYHIRVTNNCAQPLVYAVFQVPDGVVADAPANNTVYTAPSGRAYTVRNPNYSPFYAVRFSSQNTGIQSGMSDIFKYGLPPQSAPDYIHVAVKTGTSTYTEAHLNTFNCPVEFDPAASKTGEDRSSGTLVRGEEINLFPNPAEGILFADLKTLPGSTLRIRIFSAQGNLEYTQHVGAGERQLRIDLPAEMASGLYLFETMDDKGRQHVKWFVVR